MLLTGDPLIVGIDVGTSVIKAACFDLEGREHFTKRERNHLIRSHRGWVEQDMDEVWALVKKAVRALTNEAGRAAERIAAIGITGQGDGTCLIGRRGEPVRRAITWLDARACAIADRWQEEGISHEIFLITGSVPSASSQSVQLSWLKDHEPEVLASALVALHVKDWVFYQMTGEVVSDESDAGHTFFDIQKLELSQKVLDLAGISGLARIIPKVRASYQNVGRLRDDLASELGFRKGTHVVGGPFDIPATVLGLGVYSDCEVCSIIGTAGIHAMVLDELIWEPVDVGYTIRFGARGRWLKIMPSTSGIRNVEWLLDVVGLKRDGQSDDFYEDLAAVLNEVPPGSEGVIYLPFIDHLGERAPSVNSDARGEFFGLSVTTSRYSLLRAVYEGIAFAMKECYLQMPKRFSAAKVAGGGGRSAFWMQLMADVTGKTLKTSRATEFGARGAAVNAGVAVGLFKSFEQAVQAMLVEWEEFSPVDEHSQRYEKLFGLYRELHKALEPLWMKRARMLRNFSQSS